MKRTLSIALLALILAGTVAVDATAAIKRVAARYNVLNFYGGYATPHGEYHELGALPFLDQNDQLVTFDADLLLDGTYFLGADYGTLYSRYFLVLIGFRYTDHNVNRSLFANADNLEFNQYDLEFNLNFYPLDLAKSIASPYVGGGLAAGVITKEDPGYETESEIKVAFSLNFGADLKIFESPSGRSFVTLSSMNNYNLLASEDRPKYLNIGAALRYWFR